MCGKAREGASRLSLVILPPRSGHPISLALFENVVELPSPERELTVVLNHKTGRCAAARWLLLLSLLRAGKGDNSVQFVVAKEHAQ